MTLVNFVTNFVTNFLAKVVCEMLYYTFFKNKKNILVQT